MSYEVESKTLPGGHRVAVEYDPDPYNPRKEFDYLGTVVLVDRCRYNFGDEAASVEELREIYEDPANIALPVFMYDHSGITINTTGFSCRWDSGQVGIIYMTKAKAAEKAPPAPEPEPASSGAPRSDDELRAKIALLPVKMNTKAPAKALKDDDIPRTPDYSGYQFPTLDLLDEPEGNYSEKAAQFAQDQALLLMKTIETYGLRSEEHTSEL